MSSLVSDPESQAPMGSRDLRRHYGKRRLRNLVYEFEKPQTLILPQNWLNLIIDVYSDTINVDLNTNSHVNSEVTSGPLLHVVTLGEANRSGLLQEDFRLSTFWLLTEFLVILHHYPLDCK